MNSKETHMKGGGGRAMTTAWACDDHGVSDNRSITFSYHSRSAESLAALLHSSYRQRGGISASATQLDFFNIHVTALRIFTRSSTDTTKNILITPQTEPQDV